MKIKRPSFGMFIDAGFAKCGVVIVNLRKWRIVRIKTLETVAHPRESQALGFARRTREMSYQLDKLASMYDPAFVVAELPTGGAKSSRAMAMMSMATATLSVFCALRNLELLTVTPTQIKRLVRSKGPVEKREVEVVVERAFGKFLPKLKKYREHVADAAGAALVARRQYPQKFSTKLSHA